MGGYKLRDVKCGIVQEASWIVLQVPPAIRPQTARLGNLPGATPDGQTVPLAELGRFVRARQDPILYCKDLRQVEYVVGDAVGRLGAPIYPMLELEARLQSYTTPDGVVISGHYTGPPPDDGRSGFESGREWTVTYESFWAMSLAFGVALIVIYLLVVWEFGNFAIPAIIMAPIP